MNLSPRQRFLLLAIVLLALGLRTWQLPEVPPGLFYDEAVNANQAFRIAQTGEFRGWYPENFGREGLYVNLLAVTFWLLGPGLWSFRIVGAIAGVLTIPVLVWFTREWSRGTPGIPEGPSVALWGGFLLAISFWHVLLSRLGFRAGLMIPMVLLALGFLLRARRTRNTLDYLAGGMALGVGLQTYTAFPLIAVPAVLILGDDLWRARKQNRVGPWLRKAALLVFTCLVVSFPLWLAVLDSPRAASVRSYQVSVLNHPHPWKSLGESLVRHLAMFHVRGDPLWRHNVGGAPQLSRPVGLFFLVGLFLLLRYGWKSDAPVRAASLSGIFLPIVSLLVFLTAGILTHESIPHGVRTAGTVPFVYLLAGLGAHRTLAWVGDRVSSRTVRSEGMRLILAGLLAVGLTVATGVSYFRVWANHPKTRKAYLHAYTEVGRFLNRLPSSRRKVVLAPTRFAAEIPRFYENTLPPRDHPTLYVSPERLGDVSLRRGDVVITMQPDTTVLAGVRERHPGGRLVQHDDFYHYEIPGANGETSSS